MVRHSRDSSSPTAGSADCALYPPMAVSSSSYEDIRVELQDMDLWRTFTHDVTNEMIITKSGRKLFPIMRLKIRGLDPTKMYSFSMEFHQVFQNRFKYTEGGWTAAGKAEPQPTGCSYLHHKSPNFGRFWMSDTVDFSKIKVSNKKSDDKIWLNSLHKYEPRLTICRVDPTARDGEVMILQKRLEICSFMAVTSYQNEEVTNRKVKHNPFAKGFQDSRSNKMRLEAEQEEIMGQYPYPPPPYMSPSTSGNLQGTPAWNPDILQTQNIFPASFPAVHHQSQRYNPYGRTVPAVKAERGYSLDLTAPHVSSSLHQRRHASSYSTATGSAYLSHVQKPSDEQFSTGRYQGAIDLSGSNHNDPYSPTVSSSQFSYGQDAAYSQAMYNAAYYATSPYSNSAFYGNGGLNSGSRGLDQQSQPGTLQMASGAGRDYNSDSGSNSSGSPVDISPPSLIHHDTITSSQNVY